MPTSSGCSRENYRAAGVGTRGNRPEFHSQYPTSQPRVSADADSTESTAAYYKDDSATNPNAAIYIESASTGSTRLRVFYDSQGREVRSHVKGFDGAFIQADSEYDDKGRNKRSSQPYYVGDTVHWTTPSYDAVNRVVGVMAADITNDTSTDFVLNVLSQDLTRLRL